jgi:hypothetical protein
VSGGQELARPKGNDVPAGNGPAHGSGDRLSAAINLPILSRRNLPLRDGVATVGASIRRPSRRQIRARSFSPDASMGPVMN